MNHFAVPFIAGGLSGIMATLIVQPIDAIKVIQQLPNAPHGPIAASQEIYRQGGLSAFYKGIPAAIMRQVLYGTARLGLYRTGMNWATERTSGHVHFASKLAIGATAGASSSLLANPLEVVLVRLQTDLSKPVTARRNYKGVFDGLVRVAREEGIRGLWSGAVPTVLRAAILNAAMLAAADETKERLAIYTGKGTVVTLLLSSFISGVAASAASLPADMIKTRLQYQSPDVNGKLKYNGIVHATRSIIAEEGFFSLWRGLPTYSFRIGPHVFFTLVFLDFVTPIISSILN
jgi:solute carrier family 25 (mitochondrial oxoglutarate transporter), member 11